MLKDLINIIILCIRERDRQTNGQTERRDEGVDVLSCVLMVF